MGAYDYVLRQEVILKYKLGWKGTEISKAFCIGYSTVRTWIKRYELEGKGGLQPKYENSGSKRRVSVLIKESAIEMKGDHSTWGGEYIEMKLKQAYPQEYIPSGRQLRRYFVEAGLQEIKSKMPVDQSKLTWSRQTFHRVQVNAKEQIRTKDGHWSSYLTFTDENSGAVLEALVFPL